MKRFYHVYTKGLEHDVIFREHADYVVGMNYVPVSLHALDLRLLAFVLMSNHFHFMVYGTESEALSFINLYKRMISRFISNKYGTRKLMKAVQTSCSEIDVRNEGLKRIIAYVLNNPVKAGINCMPQNYEWGSGACYFSNKDPFADTIELTSMGVRAQIRLLKSETKVKQGYRINSSGYIVPQSYVDTDFVENLYGRARSLEYFLSTSNRHDGENDAPVTFSDTLVMSFINEMLEKRWGP